MTQIFKNNVSLKHGVFLASSPSSGSPHAAVRGDFVTTLNKHCHLHVIIARIFTGAKSGGLGYATRPVGRPRGHRRCVMYCIVGVNHIDLTSLIFRCYLRCLDDLPCGPGGD
jgi:hypothetical protein